MQSCSIEGCQSYKSIQWKPVAYFKFPFNNNKLMIAWLSQIDQKNFTPTIQDQICSTHFLIEDIEPTSIGRYPVLKPDAVPSVFPEKETTNSSENVPNPIQSPKFETILIPDYSNKQIPILPKPTTIGKTPISSSPIQLQTPTNQQLQFPTSPIQIVNPLLSPISPQKILKRTSTPNLAKKSSKANGKFSTTTTMSPVKHVSQLQESLENRKNIASKGTTKQNEMKLNSQETTRRPILKISINKLNDESSGKEVKGGGGVKHKTEEYIVKSLKKSVIFRLDPSGKIVVETLKNKPAPKSRTKSILKTSPKPIVVKERENSIRKSLDPKVSNLKNLYNKAQEDCEKLSKKLSNLKKRHQEEQEHILKLQGLISLPKKLEDSFNTTLLPNQIEIKKRKIIVTKNEDEDEYEKLLREVRKIKNDHEKKSMVTKVTNKEIVNIKREQLSLDYNDDEPIVTQDETINTTMSNRDHKKKLQKKVTFMKQALQEQKFVATPEVIRSNSFTQGKDFLRVNKREKEEEEEEEVVSEIAKNDEIVGVIEEEVDFDSDDEMNFEVEYLDPEFVDC
ncbi:uncharacterized protein LOC122512861 [Leptopilina heterotoma]|uniref:uncharacterized protein LOC122512861 n=1 Tax=Leptopilina heterotoma TaxID=63436 RepID=UPI001CAA16C3|nr:uncharacterized protein LOC122512861 [Leptopilina heterotoma]